MDDWLGFAAKNAVMVIEAMALLVICIGTIQAFIIGIPAMLRPSATNQRVRRVWQRYAHWLVAGLSFQLAADIIKTSVAPTWQDIGQVAAIAVIRTFLDYCLVRDLGEIRGRQRRQPGSPSSEG
jgi:uncharacterized membrane protein